MPGSAQEGWKARTSSKEEGPLEAARRHPTPFGSSGKGGELGPGLGRGFSARTRESSLRDPADAAGRAEAGQPRPRPRRAREGEPGTKLPRPAGGRRGPASIVRGRGEDAAGRSVARCARSPAALPPQTPRERTAEPRPLYPGRTSFPRSVPSESLPSGSCFCC